MLDPIESGDWKTPSAGPDTDNYRKKCERFVALEAQRIPTEEHHARALADDDSETASQCKALLDQIQDRATRSYGGASRAARQARDRIEVSFQR